jgi:hypothetical protein
MDEKSFKKHLQDLVHGHHRPEEHDWSERGAARTAKPKRTMRKRAAAKKSRAGK